jgi:hypothetical protein
MRVSFVTGEFLRSGIECLADLGLSFAVVVRNAVGCGEWCNGEDSECGEEWFFHKKERGKYASGLQESNKKCK